MATIARAGRLKERASVNRRILGAAASVTAASVLVKLVATLKEITLAAFYGRSDAMDAFLMAALIPGLLINLIAESMGQALAPTLIRVREQEGHASAQRLLSSATLCLSLLLAAVSAALAVLATGGGALIDVSLREAALFVAQAPAA